MKTESNMRKIAFIGDYLPRKCGIATFMSDLLGAVATKYPDSQCFAVPVNDIVGGYDYPNVVRFEIEEQDLTSYRRAADYINIGNAEVACVQHEFGIYGGPSGSHLLALLRELKMPIVTTLHTILQNPNDEQRRVMLELVSCSARLVVMTERGKQILQDVYQAAKAKIDLIPHGIPEMPFLDPNAYKDQFGVEGRMVFLTFGLLSPNKGIEHVLNALPQIVAEFPDVVYIVLGATHPNELRERGENYRLSLEILAKKNKIERNVIFYNRFVELEELKEFIGAADLYITPYLNEAQSTSGTLAYAFGSGKAVVSTPYWHAAELLANGRGALVPFGDSTGIAREVVKLLSDGSRRKSMQEDAYISGREMIWSNVARLYMQSFQMSRIEKSELSRKSFGTKTLDRQPRELPVLRIDHACRMTDSTGMFQHALFTIPSFSEGYCTDDNARALMLTVLLDELEEERERTRGLATTYAAFLNYAFDPKTKRFHNHLSFERRWLDEQGSEDCHARALWAFGTAAGRSPHRNFQIMAEQIFTAALPTGLDFASPRAWAFTLIGIHEYLRRMSGNRMVNQVREVLTDRLMKLFGNVSRPNWVWCEDSLTYDNAKLAHALILSGCGLGQPKVFEQGLTALRWLTKIQTSENGYFRPIGSNGFYRQGTERAIFDQQPLEAQASMSACLEAYRCTSDPWWYEQAHRAFDWFLGWNDLGVEVCSPKTGGCYDALHVDRVNENQGAESTLAFMLALAEMKLMENMLTVLKEPTFASSVAK